MTRVSNIATGLYRHYKGGLYHVFGTGIHSETLEKYVIYQCVSSGSTWLRPMEMFMSSLKHENHTVKRFSLITRFENVNSTK